MRLEIHPVLCCTSGGLWAVSKRALGLILEFKSCKAHFFTEVSPREPALQAEHLLPLSKMEHVVVELKQLVD